MRRTLIAALFLAACGGESAPAPEAAASISITPSSQSLAVGDSLRFTATVRGSRGATVNDRPVSWNSSDPSRATVAGTGMVVAISPGTAVITARTEGVSATSSLTITPAPVGSVTVTSPATSLMVGTTLQLTAAVRSAAGAVLGDRAVTWTSSDASRASVSASGLVSGVAPGSVTITATAEGRSGTVNMTVTPVPVATVTVTPDTRTLFAGATVQLTATARSATGAILSDRPTTWRTSDATRATVSATGLVTAVNPGAVAVTASVEGREGSASLTVVPVPVASIVITPDAPALLRRDTLRLSAVARDSAGNPLGGRTISWGSADATLLAVSQDGVLTGVREGTVTVTASSEGRSRTVSVRVLPGLVLRIGQLSDISNGRSIARVGDTVQVFASVDSSGTVLPVASTPLMWSSGDTAIAQTLPDGRVIGRREGLTNLRVRTIRGAVDSVPLRVFNTANVTAPALLRPASGTVFSDAAITSVPLEWGAVPNSLTVQVLELELCTAAQGVADWEPQCAFRWLPILRIPASQGAFSQARRPGWAYRWRVRSYDLTGAYGPWSEYRTLIFR